MPIANSASAFLLFLAIKTVASVFFPFSFISFLFPASWQTHHYLQLQECRLRSLSFFCSRKVCSQFAAAKTEFAAVEVKFSLPGARSSWKHRIAAANLHFAAIILIILQPHAFWNYGNHCQPVLLSDFGFIDSNTKRFKRTLIYFNTDTQDANFGGNPLCQAPKRHLYNR